MSISGFNASSSTPWVLPEFDVTVLAKNPNNKIGIYYEKGSSVDIYHLDVNLCKGHLPVFYQPSNNVTELNTALKGSRIAVDETLLDEQKQGKIPFKLKSKAPVRIKVGPVTSWMITVKVSCDITVNELTASSKIISKECGFGVKPWQWWPW